MGQYNLLFIFTDQQRFDTMAAYGNHLIQAPNLDKLASQSVLFERAYVSQPVCTPSRSTIMTGLWPHTNGCIQNNIPLQRETRCFPEMLSGSDYSTAYMGKWHLGDEVFAQHGFQEWVSIEDGYREYYSSDVDAEAKSTYHDYLIQHGYNPRPNGYFGRGQTAQFPAENCKPAFLADHACRYIQDHQNSPFALFVGFFEPHSPFFGPRNGQYDPDRIPLPSNFYAPPKRDQPLKARLFERAYKMNGHSGLPLKTEDDWKRVTANYWGLCSQVDDATGRILKTLNDCGLDDRTIVVFTSDHGDMMGSHQLIAKCVMFEEALRVPMMIRLPQQRTGRRIHEAVSQIDLVPTLLDVMGSAVPSVLQGQSLRPLLEGILSDHPRPVFAEWNGSNNGIVGDTMGPPQVDPVLCSGLGKVEDFQQAISDPVRSVVSQGRYKLNCTVRGENEFYDLCEDPCETRNLIDDPDYKTLRRKLFDKILRWQDQTNDTLELRFSNDE